MKKILIMIVVLAAVGGAAYWYMNMDVKMGVSEQVSLGPDRKAEVNTNNEGATQAQPDLPPGTNPPQQPEKFSGKIESINKGCIGSNAKGDCSVVVAGKKVVVVLNMPADLAGRVEGVPTFMDLETKIGSDADVYAQKKADGSYTLYGSGQFYLKVK